MKRIIIIVEGQTEERFVKELITPHLNKYNIWSITPILMHTSNKGRGGFVNYEYLKNEILKLLHTSKKDFIVSTFVDFFRCPKLPDYEKYCNIRNHKDRVCAMERSISEDIQDIRFLPYIQLHEFEALLFSSNVGFELIFEKKHSQQTNEIVNSYDNPEDINSTPNGAPSKRLLSINEYYNKVADGVDIAGFIGLEEIMRKCPRFASWIAHLIKLCDESNE